MKRKSINLLFWNLKMLAIIVTAVSCISKQSFYTALDFEKVPKIDAHFHYLTKNTSYIQFAKSINFKLLTPIWEGEEVPIDTQFNISASIAKDYSDDYAFFASFPTDSINNEGFAQKTIAHIGQSINSGAAGIKIWKNIGMVLKYPDGRYIMIDDPIFEPVFKYLEDKKIPVIAHLGEPKNCWLPEEKMTDPGDASYYKNNPQYHMYLHPDVPSYDEQLKARDSILMKYPGLDFIGAHLGSLEWNVDEIARRFEDYPNFRIDMAARISHLQIQSAEDYEKVRNFMIKYQDRIIYGTDNEVHDLEDVAPDKICENLKTGWMRQWLYFATDSTVNNIKGLKLPSEVIDKIYFNNAEKYFKQNTAANVKL